MLRTTADTSNRLTRAALRHTSLPHTSAHFRTAATDDSIEADDDSSAQGDTDSPESDQSFLAQDVPSLLSKMRYHKSHRNRSREHYLATRRLYFAHRSFFTQRRHVRHRRTEFVCELAMEAMIALHAIDQPYNTRSSHNDAQHDSDGQNDDSDDGSGGWQCGWLDAIKCYCYLHSCGMEARTVGCYNRLLECLLRADQDDHQGHSSPQRAVAAAPWLDAARSHLQRMDNEDITYNPYTHYLLALANLRRGNKQAADQQLSELSDLIRDSSNSVPTLSPQQWRVLFYSFARVHDSDACSLIMEDMESTVGRSLPGMKSAIAKIKRFMSAKLDKQHTFDLHSPVPYVRVPLRESVIRPLDVVDPVPPALEEVLGSHLSDYQRLIAEPPSTAMDGSDESLIAHLRQCCASEDAERAVQCWQDMIADGRESSSVTALHLLLAVLCTSNFATAVTVSMLSSPLAFVRYAERLHIQMHYALDILDTLQLASLPLPQPLAVLMLRALAYLPMPLPSADSSAQTLASSSYFASFSEDVFLSADEAASRCLTLYQLCLLSLTSDQSAHFVGPHSRLQSLLVRAHVKHRHQGRWLTDSLLSAESEEATHTPLNADAGAYLIYHYVNLPKAPLDAAYKLFSQLLLLQPVSDTPPPALAVYYLSSGELMRRNASKARRVLRDCLQRWSMYPSPWLLDALVLNTKDQVVGASDEQKEEDDTAQLLYELCTRSGDVAASLPLSLEAMTSWCERRVGHWLRTKELDDALNDRVRVDSVLAEAMLRSFLYPSASFNSIAPVSASSVPLPLLTNLLVMLSTSTALPDVLMTVVQRILSNDEYVAHNASDSAGVSALHDEAKWSTLCRTLAQPGPTESPAIETSVKLNQFTRFKAAVAARSIDSASHSSFLRRHILSRIVRCIVYSFTYTTPPSNVLLFVASLSHRLRLDLDGYALHVLLFVSSVRLLPSTPLLYRMALTASTRQAGDEYGYEASLAGIWSHTPQYAHLFQLLYVARLHGHRTRASRLEFDRLLARLLDYRMDPQLLHQLSPPVLTRGFLTNDVVVALLDISVLISSPSTLREAVSSLLLQHTPIIANPVFPVGGASDHSSCPLPRSAPTVMRGYLLAARAAYAKGWTDSGTRLAISWASVYKLCNRYFAGHLGLMSGGKSGVFLLTQRELLCRLAALSVDHNNLQPVMALYSTITELTAKSSSVAQQLIHLALFVVPIKAALLNGHKRKLSTVVKDMLAWDGLQHVTEEQVRAELARCRLGVLMTSTMQATASAHTVVRGFIGRTTIVSQRVYVSTAQPQQARQAEKAADSESSPIDSLPATSALGAAVGAYRSVLSSRLLLTDTGLQFASQLFSDIYYAHVKAKRQKAERLQREMHGEEGDEERAVSEDGVSLDDSVPGADVADDVDAASAQLQHMLYDDIAVDDESTGAENAVDNQSWSTLQLTELHTWTAAEIQPTESSRAVVQVEAPQDSAATASWADRQSTDIPSLVEQLCDESVVSLVSHARALVSSSDYKRALDEHRRTMAFKIAQLRQQQQQQAGQQPEQPRPRRGQRDRQGERDRIMAMLSRRPRSSAGVTEKSQASPTQGD